MQAFELAFSQGADGIELDVRCCASGELVVVHDADLSRMADDPRRVADLDRRQLAATDLGNGAGVPLLDDALDLIGDTDRLINVELKTDVPDRAELVERIDDCLARRSSGERERIILTSFSRSMIARLVQILPTSAIGLLFDKQPPRLGLAPGLHPRHSLVEPGLLLRYRERADFINVWTVNDGARARQLAEMGVDGIITDDIPAIMAALSRP